MSDCSHSVMKSKFYLFILFLFGGFVLCAQEAGLGKEVLYDRSVESALITKCYVCHNPRIKKSEDLIAPPMVAVKYMYKLRYLTQEEFVSKMMQFVSSPNDARAVMRGRVMEHGVMPDMSFSEEEAKSIAEFVYTENIEVPTWYPAFFERKYGIKWEVQ